jgi:polyisoprenoid-binding protein YceI
VRAVCREAVRGEVTAADARTWREARGTVTVIVDSITMGANMRDKFMHGTILHSGRYPELRFTLDSLVHVAQGDTLHALAWGIFDVHGTQDTVIAPIVVTKEGEGIRVQAKFGVAAKSMIDKYGMSRWALSLGVVLKRWNTLNMGVDLYMKPASVASGN